MWLGAWGLGCTDTEADAESQILTDKHTAHAPVFSTGTQVSPSSCTYTQENVFLSVVVDFLGFAGRLSWVCGVEAREGVGGERLKDTACCHSGTAMKVLGLGAAEESAAAAPVAKQNTAVEGQAAADAGASQLPASSRVPRLPLRLCICQC